MILSTVPGYPRIGRQRDLKKAVESYWQGKLTAVQLEDRARELRAEHFRRMLDSGVRLIPAGDFSFYDGVLDLAVLLGWVPERYRQADPLGTYFGMARGTQSVPALEMTKWFDTNYHYIVPELTGPAAPVSEAEDRLLALYREARGIVGERAKPVLIGPYTLLRLARAPEGPEFAARLDELGDAYAELVGRLVRAGADWVQIDEPALVLSGEVRAADAFVRAYEAIARTGGRILLQTYFGPVREHRALIQRLPVAGIGVDLCRGTDNWAFLDEAAAGAWGERTLAAGVLDGRSVWRADLAGILDRLEGPARALGERLWIGTSCSLQFLPYSVDAEPKLDPQIKRWLSFAEERLGELETLRRGLDGGRDAVRKELDESSAVRRERADSQRTTNPEVRARLADLNDGAFRRAPFGERRSAQEAAFRLPLLPTTTIGSFPQTSEVRQSRSRYKSGAMSEEAYHEYVRGEIEKVIELQEEIGLDVLVHGEFERSDMVDYFGEQLDGMAVTENGWVQSYGTRCVRPPIIYGDIVRPVAMTVRESRLAQLMTRRPVKGMLTGPVTILNWSFPRDDIARSETAFQLALALRDETRDLEEAGIGMIQIDEPAFREGLPLRAEQRDAYLDWAVRAFRLASSGVRPETQIHTHMCYSDFNEILQWIAAMDADVLSIENSRSSGDLLRAFREFRYGNWIGPGVYDIHSPRIPTEEEMEALLRRTLEVLPAALVWVNPDCGLKTRGYAEVVPALRNMVEAAKRMRSELAG